MTESVFPLEFPYTRIVAERFGGDGVRDVPYIVAGMVTANYADKARKLIDSCRKFRLPHVIYEVPTVHQSISPKGAADLRFTKANFIHYVLEKFDKPILYLDVDTYFAQYPEAIETIAKSKCEFAIYNWLADEHTEAYRPVEVNVGTATSPVMDKKRFFVFSHSIDFFTTDQLICSGAVQFYGNTPAAKDLLRSWHNTVKRFDNVADDQCLDFTYNNYPENVIKPKACWLDKSYARYAFWVYVKPVINHPDWPYGGEGFVPLEDPEGRKRFYPEQAQRMSVEYVFPKSCVIDSEKKFICRVEAGELVPYGKLDRKLWI